VSGTGGEHDRETVAERRPPLVSILFRALAVQGSWNYETLSGTGFAFVILPALRRMHRGDERAVEEALRRHEGPFNSHPYLAPLAIGAVIRMEEDAEDPAVIDRFKAALRGSLGTLGDQLVWAGWRPVCLLGALVLLLLGISWWGALLTFLLVYNLGHVGMMYWGLSVGLTEGRGVAERLRGSIRSTQPRLMAAGAFLAGLVMVLVVVDGVPGLLFDPGWLWAVAAVGCVAAGARWGERVRPVAVGGAVALAVIGVLAGVIT
jgi:PTS system mannose-specific IID component